MPPLNCPQCELACLLQSVMAGRITSLELSYLGTSNTDTAWCEELVAQASVVLVAEGVRLPAHREVGALHYHCLSAWLGVQWTCLLGLRFRGHMEV